MRKKLQEAFCIVPDLSIIHPPILLLLCVFLQTSVLSPRAVAAVINCRDTALQFLLLSFAKPGEEIRKLATTSKHLKSKGITE